ncbi:MAG: ribonuclease III [Bacteroidaceae bacterium]|nr:ribonuclease III [Bacteroidaceae bacterium]
MISTNVIDKIRLTFIKNKEPYLNLYNIMGFYPHNPRLYQTALRHRSCHNPHTKKGESTNNERLEFLGDAVLSAVVADILYKQYNKSQEGFLTTLRSKLVKRETLNQLAVQIGLDKLVLHSNNVPITHNSYMNGNAFEAFLGAIYLDRGYKYCKWFMDNKIFNKHLDIDKIAKTEENFKSMLIEWCQKNQLKVQFKIVDEEMESNNVPKFYSIVDIEGVVCGHGNGYTKKESHQNAARSAMKKVKSNVAFVNKLYETRNQNNNTALADTSAEK